MTEYQKNICLEVSKTLLIASRLLREADDNMFDLEGCEALYTFYGITQLMLTELHQEYYAKSQMD